MAAKKERSGPRRVREQVVVYLEARDRQLLEEMVSETGLPRTELLRQGLWHYANRMLTKKKAGWATDYLIATASDDGLPPDVAERHDYYLARAFEDERRQWKKPKPKRRRARSS